MVRKPEALRLSDGVVLLDRFTDADVEALWAGEDNDHVRRSHLPGPFSRGDIAGRIMHWERQWQAGGPELSFAVREAETRTLVGGCVLEIHPDRELAELTYWVFPPRRRRGYATRSVELVCRYAFDILGIVRVELYIEPTNDPSLRVAAKAGFVDEGLARQDMVRFSRVRAAEDDARRPGPSPRSPVSSTHELLRR